MVTLFADADLLIEQFALWLDFTAGSVDIEVESNGAAETSVSVPFSTAEIVVEDFQSLRAAGYQVKNILRWWT